MEAMARTLELPYDASTGCAERHAWFERLRPLGWAAFLDSGDRARTGGRYDILAAGPVASLVSQGGRAEILRDGSEPAVAENAFAGLRSLLEGTAPGDAAWPIAGGAIGYLGYELGRGAAKLPADKTGTTAQLCGDFGILVAQTPTGQRVPYAIVGIIEKGNSARAYSSWVASRTSVIRSVSNVVYLALKDQYGLV